MSSRRIYVAFDTEGKVRRLVWAGHPSQAKNHCFAARVASQGDLLELVNAGVHIETAAPLPGDGQPGEQPELQPSA
jgi:hypothetical protein